MKIEISLLNLAKAKSRKKIYVPASPKHKAYWREAEVGHDDELFVNKSKIMKISKNDIFIFANAAFPNIPTTESKNFSKFVTKEGLNIEQGLLDFIKKIQSGKILKTEEEINAYKYIEKNFLPLTYISKEKYEEYVKKSIKNELKRSHVETKDLDNGDLQIKINNKEILVNFKDNKMFIGDYFISLDDPCMFSGKSPSVKESNAGEKIKIVTNFYPDNLIKAFCHSTATIESNKNLLLERIKKEVQKPNELIENKPKTIFSKIEDEIPREESYLIERAQNITDLWYNEYGLGMNKVGALIKKYMNNELELKDINKNALDLLITGAKEYAEKNGNEYIYRGETKYSARESFINAIINLPLEAKTIDIDSIGHMSCWSESEHVADVFSEKMEGFITIKGIKVKSIKYKIPKKEYLNNVVMHYAVSGSGFPEQEVTLLPNKIMKFNLEDIILDTSEGKITAAEFRKRLE